MRFDKVYRADHEYLAAMRNDRRDPVLYDESGLAWMISQNTADVAEFKRALEALKRSNPQEHDHDRKFA